MASETTFDHWRVVFLEEEWEKLNFLQTSLIPDFALLDSESTHYHVPIKKKIHCDKLYKSQSMFLSLVETVFSISHECWQNQSPHSPAKFFNACERRKSFCRSLSSVDFADQSVMWWKWVECIDRSGQMALKGPASSDRHQFRGDCWNIKPS